MLRMPLGSFAVLLVGGFSGGGRSPGSEIVGLIEGLDLTRLVLEPTFARIIRLEADSSL